MDCQEPFFNLPDYELRKQINIFVCTSPDTHNMPLVHIDIEKNIPAAIYFWKIEENCEELAGLFAGGDTLLADAVRRFRSVKRQQEWLATRALLMQTPYSNMEILYHSNGKPYLSDNSKHISISHTHSHVAIAISERAIGIDIEAKERNAYAVVASYLQPQEREALSTTGNPQKEAIRLWTAKEAAFKLYPTCSAVIKDIGIAPITTNGSTATYDITYKDGTKALCHTNEHEYFILSACTIV